MAKCDLCGDSAGIFKNRHPSCELKAQSLKRNLHDLVLSGILAGMPCSELKAQTETKLQEEKLPNSYFQQAMLLAANDGAMQISQKAPIPPEEFTRLHDLLIGFGFPEGNRDEILGNGLWGMAFAGMSNVLWEVQNDVVPYYDGMGKMQFNLRHGEQPIYSCGKVTFAEERTVNTGSRVFSGFSVPIGAGVYSHVGASQAGKVSGLLPIDVGAVLVTSQALYFGGQQRTLRISLSNVLRYEPYADGVGVCEAAGPPKVFVPDYSGMDTGWFLFNLLSTLTSKLPGPC